MGLLSEAGGSPSDSEEQARPWEALGAHRPEPFDPRETSSTFGSLKKLRLRHHKIISMAAAGMKQVDIAKALGVTPQTVCSTLASPVAQDTMRTYEEGMLTEAVDLKKHMEELGPLAISVFEENMLHGDGKLKHQAAKEVMKYLLEQAGTKVKHEHEHTITPQEIDLMLARAKELKPDNLIEDADYEMLPPSDPSDSPSGDS